MRVNNIEFQKRLYNMQTNALVTRINVTSDFRIHFYYEIVHATTTM